MGMIEAILVGVLATFLAAECLDWLPRFTEFLIRVAAKSVPEESRHRYYEEWLTDVVHVPGKTGKLIYAVNLILIRTAARLLPEDSRDRYYEEWLAEAAHVPGKITSRLIYALDLIRASFFIRNPRPSKRIFDVAFASIIIMTIAPLLAFIALLIALETGPPIFYLQPRIGRGGRGFDCLRFRTMVPNADAVLARHLAEHPEAREEWRRYRKLKHDPRFTSLGAWLRRTSLDELPQLINVIRGEMSLVGPRPGLQDEQRRYGADLFYETEIKPGITGLSQVSGRNVVDRVRLDSWYVKNWSVWCDLVILIRTLRVALLGQSVEKGSIKPFRVWRRFWRRRIRRFWRDW